MGVTVDQPDLFRALARIRPAVKPSTSKVRIQQDADGELCLTADNGDLRIATLMTADGELGDVCVPYRTLAAFARATRKDSTIRLAYDDTEDKLWYVSHAGTVTVPVAGYKENMNSPEFLDVPGRMSRPPDVCEWKVCESMLAALRYAMVACSDDWARPVLCNVEVRPEGTVVSTDGYRLAHMTADDPPPDVILVPRSVLRAIPGDVTEALVSYGGLGSRFLEFACDNGTTITTYGLDAVFPNWSTFIGVHHPLRVAVDRDALLAALNVVVGFRDNHSIDPLRLVVADGVLSMIQRETQWDAVLETAVDVTDTIRNGVKQLTVGFNPWYFRDGIRSIPSPIVHLSMVDALKPIMVSDPEDMHRYVLMPIRIA